MTRNDMYPVPMGLVSADTSKRRIEGGNIAQSRIMLEFARPETGSIDHLRDALRVDTSGGARGGSRLRRVRASAARSEAALYKRSEPGGGSDA